MVVEHHPEPGDGAEAACRDGEQPERGCAVEGAPEAEKRAKGEGEHQAVARGDGSSRIHDSPKLHSADGLVPRVQGRRYRRIPGSVAVEKGAARVAELQLHDGSAAIWPLRSF